MSGKLRKFDQNLLRTGATLAARVKEPVPFCWFCSAAGGSRTKEHIFPQWLLRHYGARYEMVQPHRISFATGTPVLASERPERPLSAHVNGEVCATCNNGWLSSLDAAVQPILQRERKRGRLQEAEAETLARWFVKVAINLNVTQPYRLLVPAVDRHALSDGMPRSFSVELFRVRRQNGVVDWVQGQLAGLVIPAGADPETQRLLAEQILVVHIRIADLVAVVTRLPEPLQVQHLSPAENTARIWPLPPRLPTWGGLPRHEDYLSAPRFIVYEGALPFL